MTALDLLKNQPRAFPVMQTSVWGAEFALSNCCSSLCGNSPAGWLFPSEKRYRIHVGFCHKEVTFSVCTHEKDAEMLQVTFALLWRACFQAVTSLPLLHRKYPLLRNYFRNSTCVCFEYSTRIPREMITQIWEVLLWLFLNRVSVLIITWGYFNLIYYMGWFL